MNGFPKNNFHEVDMYDTFTLTLIHCLSLSQNFILYIVAVPFFTFISLCDFDNDVRFLCSLTF